MHQISDRSPPLYNIPNNGHPKLLILVLMLYNSQHNYSLFAGLVNHLIEILSPGHPNPRCFLTNNSIYSLSESRSISPPNPFVRALLIKPDPVGLAPVLSGYTVHLDNND